MIVEVLNKNFSEVRVAALYKEGETTATTEANQILYHACRNNAIITDFLEYDLRAKVRKNLYNNFFKLDYLKDDLKNKLKNKLENLELYDSVIVPTTLRTKEEHKESAYFGSIQLNSETNLFIIDVPEDIKYIEFYTGNDEDIFKETKLELNNNDYDDDRVILVTFGPEESKNYSSLDYSKYMDEIYSRKIIALLTTGSDVTINLVQNSWDNSENANRNKSNYTLRNDDFYSSKQYLSLFGEDKLNFLEDLRSGTILHSTKELKNGSEDVGPILKKKLEKAESNLANNLYNPRVTYHKGDKVFYNGKYWYSVSNFNNNNIPSLSPKNWLINSLIEDYYSTIVEVKIFSENNLIDDLTIDGNNTIYLTKYSMFINIDVQISESIYVFKTNSDNTEDIIKSIYFGTTFENRKPIEEISNFSSIEITKTGDVIYMKSSDKSFSEILKDQTLFLEYRQLESNEAKFSISYHDESGNTIVDDKLIKSINDSITVRVANTDEIGKTINNSLLNEYLSKDYVGKSIEFVNNASNDYVYYFKINNDSEITTTTPSKLITQTVNNISIFVTKPKYVITVQDSIGIFETSGSRFIVNRGDSLSFDFYISRDFDTGDADDINYTFTYLKLYRDGKTYKFDKSRSGEITEIENTDYTLGSFSFCSSTYSERLDREVYTLNIPEITSNVVVELFAQPIK